MAEEQKRATPILGCDIGNGFAYVSVLETQQSDPLPLLQNSLAGEGMPSAAFVPAEEQEPIQVYDLRRGAPTGLMARYPGQTIRAVKTRMKEETLPIANSKRRVTPDQVYAAIVRDLVNMANDQRKQVGQEPVYDLVFTFPASFIGQVDLLNRMEKSIESVTLDGHALHVAGRLPEPAAVALDYLYYTQHLVEESQRRKEDHITVLVYDLGHGTFDTAIVTAGAGETPYLVRKQDGLPDVGGKDFEELIFDCLRDKLRQEHQIELKNTMQEGRLREVARMAKYALSDGEEYVDTSFTRPDDTEAELVITKREFETLSQPLVNRTLELVQDMLDEAEEEGIQVDAIVFSGGASRMPMIKAGLLALTKGRYPVEPYRYSQAVSFGAARYALSLQPAELPEPEPGPQTKKEEPSPKPAPAPQPKPVLEQLTEFSYGIWLPDETLTGHVEQLIPKGSKLPAGNASPLLLRSNSSRMTIRVRRSENTRKAGNQEKGNELWFHFDVPANAVCGITLEVDANYHITVRCALPDGKVLTHSTADYAKREERV